MADNVAITAGTGTTIAADDIGGGVLAQRVKATWGPDGTANDTDIANGKPMPVQVRSATGLIPLGEPTDAKSTATDGTSASIVAVLKQCSQSLQDLASGIGDDAAFTPGTSKVSVIGLQADESSTDSVDEGDAGAPRMTLDRKAIVTPQPHTAGGLSIFRSIDLDEGALEVVKNAPGQVYGIWITNTATATRFVKFYDAASGTLGTGTPVITIGIPGNSSDDVAGLFSSTMGIAFGTGICVGAGTGVADNDTGAPGANDIIINVFYK